MSETTNAARPEAQHAPSPVIWSEPAWDYVAQRRIEAEILRKIKKHAEADSHDAETDRLALVLIQCEGDVWVSTARAVEMVSRMLGRPAKADTIRSWGRREGTRRQKVRSCQVGTSLLFHRNDLVAMAATSRDEPVRHGAAARKAA